MQSTRRRNVPETLQSDPDRIKPSHPGGGRIESPSEKLTTNNPMQQRMPTLEFIDGGNNVDRISGSKAISDLLEPAFPDRGSQLLPSNPEA